MASLIASTVEVSDQHRKVREESQQIRNWLSEGPWQLRAVCFLACAGSTVASFMMVLGAPSKFLLTAYAGLLSFLGAVMEVKAVMCTRRCKARTEYWIRMLSRVWGRGVFYLLIASMQLVQGSLFGFLAGAAMAFAGGFSLFVSHNASKKINELHKGLVKQYGVRDTERVREAFRAVDKDGSGALSPTELAGVAVSLGAELTSDELAAVFAMLDADRDGKIEFDEFNAWWQGVKDVNYSWV